MRCWHYQSYRSIQETVSQCYLHGLHKIRHALNIWAASFRGKVTSKKPLLYDSLLFSHNTYIEFLKCPSVFLWTSARSCQPSTMVDPKPPGKGRGSTWKPAPSATTPVLLFRLGYTAPVTLIGLKTMDPSILAIREKNNEDAYASKTWSRQDWNAYVTFGIQNFDRILD